MAILEPVAVRTASHHSRRSAILVEIAIILGLIAINGALAGAEIAIVSLRQSRMEELVEAGRSGARALEALRDSPERFLATVQIGITVVSASAGAFGGATLAEDLAPVLSAIPPLAPFASELSLAAVVTGVSYFSLVLGELIPKSLALKSPETFALIMGRPLYWLSVAARPLVWFLTASSNLVLRFFKDETSFVETRLSPEELVRLVEDAAKAGTVDARVGAIASRALHLPSLTAAEVMVPRPQVVALRRSASREELRRVLLEHTHSRFPVVGESSEEVVGYVSVKDILAMAWEESLFVLDDLLRPAFFVPRTKGAVDLLSEMRARRIPFVVVVEEHGGMAGIVAMEDLLEELVGEIFSEHTRSVPEFFRREPDGGIVVLGSVTIRDVNRELGLKLPETGSWTTMAGLCLALFLRIPTVGERVLTSNGIALEVVDASPRRVRAVRIVIPAVAAPPGAAS
jgi:putative hemolysin